MGGSPRMLLAQVPQMVQAATMMGVEMSKILPALGIAGAAIAAITLAWHAYGDSAEKAAEQQAKLLESLKNLPGAISQINSLLLSGRLSPAMANEYADYLTGKKKLYKSTSGDLTPLSTETLDNSPPGAARAYTAAVMGPVAPSSLRDQPQQLPLAQASMAEVQNWVRNQLAGLSGIGDTRIDAINKLKELERQQREESLSGLEKEEAKIHDRYEQERREIEETMRMAGGLMTQKEQTAAQDALALSKQNEASAITAARFKDEQEKEQRAVEAAEKRKVELAKMAEQERADLERQLTQTSLNLSMRRGDNYEHEYQERMRLLESQKYEGLIDEREYTDGVIEATNKRLEGQQRAAQRAIQLLQQVNANREKELQLQQQLVQGNPYLSEIQKAEQLLPILQAQVNEIQNKLLPEVQRQLQGKGLTAEERARLEGRRLDLSEKQQGLETQIDTLQDQTSMSGQFKRTLAQLSDQWGSWAQQTATAFKTVFNSAIQSISNGITGLIMGTKTWGQALMQIGTTVLQSIIQAIVEMGTRWVLTHVIMGGALMAFHALARALGWEQVAETNAQEAAKAPALAMNASTASVSSYGAAAIVGIAALVAALGLGLAAALGAFEEGGFTGGREGQLAGVVHGGEFVFSAPAVRAAGAGRLAEIHDGLLGRGSPGAGGGQGTRVVIVDDMRTIRQLDRDPEFTDMIVRVNQLHSWRYRRQR